MLNYSFKNNLLLSVPTVGRGGYPNLKPSRQPENLL